MQDDDYHDNAMNESPYPRSSAANRPGLQQVFEDVSITHAETLTSTGKEFTAYTITVTPSQGFRRWKVKRRFR